MKRFEEGFVYLRNPLFSRHVTRYVLTPDKVDCVVFCSKNYAPILNGISQITSRFNTYFHYTITAYGKDLEPGVPSIPESIETLKKLSAIVGKQRISWRYDPILLTSEYTLERHLNSFEQMAKEIAPYVYCCVFSFVEMYKRFEENLPSIIPLTEEDKNRLAEGLGRIAKRYGLKIQTCGTEADYSAYGISPSGCMNLEILSQANNIVFKNLKHKGTRIGCHCIESRDIGAYNTCLNGCKYCYANKKPQLALKNYQLHDPNSPILLGSIQETDIVTQADQKSFLVKEKEKITEI